MCTQTEYGVGQDLLLSILAGDVHQPAIFTAVPLVTLAALYLEVKSGRSFERTIGAIQKTGQLCEPRCWPFSHGVEENMY